MKSLSVKPQRQTGRTGIKLFLLSLLSLLLLLSCKKEEGEKRGEVLVGHITEKGSHYPISGAQVFLIGSKSNQHGQLVDYVISRTETNKDGEYIIDFPKVSNLYYLDVVTADHYPKRLWEPGEPMIDVNTRIHDVSLYRRTKTLFRVRNLSGGSHNVSIDTERDGIAGLHGPGLDTTFSLDMNAYDSNQVIISEYKPGNPKISQFKVWVGYNNQKDTVTYTY